MVVLVTLLGALYVAGSNTRGAVMKIAPMSEVDIKQGRYMTKTDGRGVQTAWLEPTVAL